MLMVIYKEGKWGGLLSKIVPETLNKTRRLAYEEELFKESE